jgi:hypothetical protein
MQQYTDKVLKLNIIVVIFSKATLRIFNRSPRPKNRTVSLTMLNILICLWFTGQPDEVKSTSGRIVNLTSYVTSMVLMAAYSAFLISSLAVQHRALPFRNLQGILDDGSYKLGVMRNSSNFNIFNVWERKYLQPDYLLRYAFIQFQLDVLYVYAVFLSWKMFSSTCFECYLHPSSGAQLQCTAIGFLWFWCVLFHTAGTGAGTLWHISTVSYRVWNRPC